MDDKAIGEIIAALRPQRRDNAQYEVKKCAHDLSKDVWETESTFANTDGGTLLLGVSERDGFVPVAGFQIDRVCDQLVSGMGDGGSPGVLTNPPEYHVDRAACEGGAVLVVHVEELPPAQKPCYITARGVQGGSYRRIDDKDVRLSRNELYAIQSAMLVDHSDREPVEGAEVSDLDGAVCEAAFSRALLVAPRSLRGADDVSEWLRRLNFTDSRGRVIRAGLLVAGVYPQQFFPKLHVDVAVHPGTAKGTAGALRFRDRTVCEGMLGEMIEEAVAVDIFDDRVEVINPGGLWGKSRADLADGRSCCRNATIMRLMSLVPLPSGAGSPAEGNGSGIPLMMAEMAAGGLEPPEFCPAMDHFKVILRRPQGDEGGGAATSKGEAHVEAVLREVGQMSVRELCGPLFSRAHG